MWRALRPTPHQLLIREMILQLKRGFLEVSYFREKFGEDILDVWRNEFEQYRDEGLLTFDDQRVELTRAGLLQVDAMLPAFFEPQFRGVRYT